MARLLRYFVSVVFFLLLACEGDKIGDIGLRPIERGADTVIGNVVGSQVQNAAIEAFDLSEDLVAGNLVASTITDEKGFYALEIKGGHIYEIAASGGKILEEGELKDFSEVFRTTVDLSSTLATQKDFPKKENISIASTLATEYAKKLRDTLASTPVDPADLRANRQMARIPYSVILEDVRQALGGYLNGDISLVEDVTGEASDKNNKGGLRGGAFGEIVKTIARDREKKPLGLYIKTLVDQLHERGGMVLFSDTFGNETPREIDQFLKDPKKNKGNLTPEDFQSMRRNFYPLYESQNKAHLSKLSRDEMLLLVSELRRVAQNGFSKDDPVVDLPLEEGEGEETDSLEFSGFLVRSAHPFYYRDSEESIFIPKMALEADFEKVADLFTPKNILPKFDSCPREGKMVSKKLWMLKSSNEPAPSLLPRMVIAVCMEESRKPISRDYPLIEKIEVCADDEAQYAGLGRPSYVKFVFQLSFDNEDFEMFLPLKEENSMGSVYFKSTKGLFAKIEHPDGSKEEKWVGHLTGLSRYTMEFRDKLLVDMWNREGFGLLRAPQDGITHIELFYGDLWGDLDTAGPKIFLGRLNLSLKDYIQRRRTIGITTYPACYFRFGYSDVTQLFETFSIP